MQYFTPHPLPLCSAAVWWMQPGRVHHKNVDSASPWCTQPGTVHPLSPGQCCLLVDTKRYCSRPHPPPRHFCILVDTNRYFSTPTTRVVWPPKGHNPVLTAIIPWAVLPPGGHNLVLYRPMPQGSAAPWWTQPHTAHPGQCSLLVNTTRYCSPQPPGQLCLLVDTTQNCTYPDTWQCCLLVDTIQDCTSPPTLGCAAPWWTITRYCTPPTPQAVLPPSGHNPLLPSHLRQSSAASWLTPTSTADTHPQG